MGLSSSWLLSTPSSGHWHSEVPPPAPQLPSTAAPVPLDGPRSSRPRSPVSGGQEALTPGVTGWRFEVQLLLKRQAPSTPSACRFLRRFQHQPPAPSQQCKSKHRNRTPWGGTAPRCSNTGAQPGLTLSHGHLAMSAGIFGCPTGRKWAPGI